MLFMVTHRHAPDDCMADDPRPLQQLASDAHAREAGVRVHGIHVAAAEHTIYVLLEADEAGRVVRFLRPVMPIGEHDIVPVQPVAEALATLR